MEQLATVIHVINMYIYIIVKHILLLRQDEIHGKINDLYV